MFYKYFFLNLWNENGQIRSVILSYDNIIRKHIFNYMYIYYV